MSKYKKISPRLSVQFIDADTENVLVEIPNKNWMNIGELFTEHYVNEIIKNHIPKNKPKNIMVIVVGEYTLT